MLQKVLPFADPQVSDEFFPFRAVDDMRLRFNLLCPRAQCLATTAEELSVALTSTTQLLHIRVNCLVLDNLGESHKHSEGGPDHDLCQQTR
jgi:hypothetical protein